MENLPTASANNGTPQFNGRASDLVATTQAATQQFVSFFVADQEFALDIVLVREIRGWSETTGIPAAPEYMRGVVNLRGTIVPIFDLRARFGQGLTKVTPKHVVIIVNVASRVVGVLVDAVSDILTVGEQEIRPVPSVSGSSGDEGSALLSGLVAVGDKMVAIISLEAVLSGSEVSLDSVRELTALPA